MSRVLEGSQQPYIRDSTINVSTTIHTTSPRGFERLIQAVAPNAFHNSDDRPDPLKCHENTRVAVIKKIMDWVTGRIDTDAFMLWLYGPAGAGKSAIARTIAEICAGQGLLLASFLFFRSDSKRNTMTSLVANIAYCVTCVIPGAREPINTIIEADPLILSYSVEVQLTKLVLEPLRVLAEQGYFSHGSLPPLVIIDGLDECLDKGAQTNLIQLLSSSAARYELDLKFLIASRPEAHIKSAVGLAGQRSIISLLELNDDFRPDKDIHRFLTDKFREIKTCHPFRSQIPSFWPSEQQMDTLVRKASGQFIYASLAVRSINCACDSPTRQLNIVLGLRPPIDHDLPFAELDTLYTFILSGTKNVDIVLRILGVYDAVEETEGPVGYGGIIEPVLGLEDGDVGIYLSPLSSLLEFREGFHEIHFHHSSFMDFLHTPERSKEYWVDARQSHNLIAQWILGAFTSNAPSVCRPEIIDWLSWVDLGSHLTSSLWTLELERALENFSLPAYMAYLHQFAYCRRFTWYKRLPKSVFDYLGAKDKLELRDYHCLKYTMLSVDSWPIGEKFDFHTMSAEEIYRQWLATSDRSALIVSFADGRPLELLSLSLITTWPPADTETLLTNLPSESGSTIFVNQRNCLLVRCARGSVLSITEVKPLYEVVQSAAQVWNGLVWMRAGTKSAVLGASLPGEDA